MRSKTYIAVPPGATIKEQLNDREMTQKEFASRLDMSEKHISKLINGEVQLTSEMAVKLEMVLGIPAQFWNNMESIYREKIEKVKAENEMDQDIEIMRKMPYKEMAEQLWVPKTRKPQERVIHLRNYFELSRLELIYDPSVLGIACRKVGESEKSDYALLAWAQKAKLEARHVDVAPIDIEKLRQTLPKIRAMTRQEPSVFSDILVQTLKQCGIALVYLPHIGGSFLHGATFRQGSKIVVGLTVRGRYADKFWFSLFHEMGHIILGHLDHQNEKTKEEENAADEFARDFLIPGDPYKDLINRGRFDRKTILEFSSEQEIDPGIVVGRLQFEKYIPHDRYNDMRTKYQISDS